MTKYEFSIEIKHADVSKDVNTVWSLYFKKILAIETVDAIKTQTSQTNELLFPKKVISNFKEHRQTFCRAPNKI